MLLAVLAAAPSLRLNLNALDIAILIIYFALVIAIGFLARRAIATSEDFLLAGRSLCRTWAHPVGPCNTITPSRC